MPAELASIRHRKKTPTGPKTPPKVATRGLMAFLIGLRLPPGRAASVISFAATPKKNTMKMSLIRKEAVTGCPKMCSGRWWIPCASWPWGTPNQEWYHSGAKLAARRPQMTPAMSGIENSWRR